jgi:hypothetical protein
LSFLFENFEELGFAEVLGDVLDDESAHIKLKIKIVWKDEEIK